MQCDGLVNRIISNFQIQLALYREMQQESRNQLETLQSSSASLDMGAILERRHRLLSRLDNLAIANRQLQQQFLEHSGLEEFNLSGLQSCLAEKEWSVLNEIITQLAQMLREITACDKQSQGLMTLRGAGAAAKKTAPVDHNQARQAYRRAQRQNMDKPR